MKKEQKGITLIALIITIIVMLILVAVTINVALNGGLIDKANNAATQMKEQTIYEEVLGSMVLTNSGMIDVIETAKAAKTTLESEGKTVSIKVPTDMEGEEITVNDLEGAGYVTLKVDDKYYCTITHSRIIAGELEILTWADVGITNVTLNTYYANTMDNSYKMMLIQNNEGITAAVMSEGEEDDPDSPAIVKSLIDNKTVKFRENYWDMAGEQVINFKGDYFEVNIGEDNFIYEKES